LPHIINIAAKTGLKHSTVLNQNDSEVEASELEDTTLEYDYSGSGGTEYQEALASDVISLARKLVSALRASGQRWKGLKDKIREGNEAGWWEGYKHSKMSVLALIRDVDT
jgi:hypothetical protein